MGTAMNRLLAPAKSASIPARLPGKALRLDRKGERAQEDESSESQRAAAPGAKSPRRHSFGDMAVLAPAAASTMVEVSEPGDAAEQAAGQAAERVMGLLSTGTPVDDGGSPGKAAGLGPISLTATGLAVQRAANDGAAAHLPAGGGGFLVDDEATTLPGQMRKSEFLSALRPAVCAAADRELARAGRKTDGCPYLDRWFGYFQGQDAQHVERSLRKYAPETASARSANGYIAPISTRVAQGVRRWVDTGELPELPEGITPAMLAGGGLAGALATVGSAVKRGLSAIGSFFGGLFRKATGSGAGGVDRGALSAQLGEGQPLDGRARARMGSAFGHDFGAVRVHTDASAAALAAGLDARAFTLGTHIAFGAGQYHPGAPAGDVLIAHELAHVVQQSGHRPSEQPVLAKGEAHDEMEQEADGAALDVAASLWGGSFGVKPPARDARPNRQDAGEFAPGTPTGDALVAHEMAHLMPQWGGAMPAPALENEAGQAAAAAVLDLKGRPRRELSRQRGLRLQRCGGTDLRKGTSMPTSAQQTNIRSDLDFPITPTHTAGQPGAPVPQGVSESAAAASTEWAGAKHAGDTPAQTAAAVSKRVEIKAKLLAGITTEFDRQLKDAKATQANAGTTSINEFEGAANAAKGVVDERYSDFLAGGISVGAPRPGEFHAGANLLSSYDVAARKAHDAFASPEMRVYNLATYSGPKGEPSPASSLRGAPYFYNINRNDGDPAVDPLNKEAVFFNHEVRDPFVAAHKSDLDLITQYNYAVTDPAGGTVLISPSGPDAGAKWIAFATTTHEYLHLLTHPIFRDTANKTMNEGFTEYFTYQALTALPWQTAPKDDRLRAQVEAPNPGPPFSFAGPYKSPPSYQGYVGAAVKAKSELGSGEGAENAVRGAYFQGHVELLGFAPKSPGKEGPVATPNLAKGQREHIVIESGGAVETGAIIAKIHDVKLADLQKANPGLDLDKLKAGDRVLVPK